MNGGTGLSPVMPYRYIWQKMVMIPAGLCLLMGIAVLPAFPTPVVTPETPVPAARAATRLSGRVIAIQDGDTLTLLDMDRRSWRIRLAEIDAPEKDQPFGQKSRQSLAELIFGRTVTAECPSADRYGRLVCTVRDGERDINAEQLRRGMAWVFRRYATRMEYFRIEAAARAAGRGLWSDPHPVPPWEWRRPPRVRS